MPLPEGRKPLTKDELQRILDEIDRPPPLTKKPKKQDIKDWEDE